MNLDTAGFLTGLPVVNRKNHWVLVYDFIWEFVTIVHIVVKVVFDLTVHPNVFWVVVVVVFVWRYPKNVLGHI